MQTYEIVVIGGGILVFIPACILVWLTRHKSLKTTGDGGGSFYDGGGCDGGGV